MIRKFLRLPRLGAPLLALFLISFPGANKVVAQATDQPAQTQPQAQGQQQPTNPQPSTQDEEEIPQRKPKPRLYDNWTFNVGGGASLPNGTTAQYIRGGGGIGAAGVAHNYNQYFGLRFDFQFDNLPLKTSTLRLVQAPSGNSRVYSFNFDPIINIPASRDWGGYIVFGPSYFHRSGKLDSSNVLLGSACNGFWRWWGSCYNNALPLNKSFLSSSLNEYGYNFGAGITRKITGKYELYGEFRYLHGTHNGPTTDIRPITVGIRW